MYSYGRYDTNATWGTSGSKGEGVLVVADKGLYLKRESERGVTVAGYVLDTTEEESKKIQQFYTDLISDDGIYWKSNDAIKSDMYKFNKDSEYYEYKFAGGANCATMVVDALENGIKDKMLCYEKSYFSGCSPKL